MTAILALPERTYDDAALFLKDFHATLLGLRHDRHRSHSTLHGASQSTSSDPDGDGLTGTTGGLNESTTETKTRNNSASTIAGHDEAPPLTHPHRWSRDSAGSLSTAQSSSTSPGLLLLSPSITVQRAPTRQTSLVEKADSPFAGLHLRDVVDLAEAMLRQLEALAAAAPPQPLPPPLPQPATPPQRALHSPRPGVKSPSREGGPGPARVASPSASLLAASFGPAALRTVLCPKCKIPVKVPPLTTEGLSDTFELANPIGGRAFAPRMSLQSTFVAFQEDDRQRSAGTPGSAICGASLTDRLFSVDDTDHAAITVTTQEQLRRGEDQLTGLDVINDYIVWEPLAAGAQGQTFVVIDTRSGKKCCMKVVRRDRVMLAESPSASTLNGSTWSTVGSATARHSSGAVEASDGGTTTTVATAAAGPRDINREVAILKRLHHSNIVRLFEVIDDPQENRLYLFMELVEGGPVAKMQRASGEGEGDGGGVRCETIPIPALRRHVFQMARGLHYLHRHGVVHRDVKPENIMLDRETGRVVLIDFGVSEFRSSDAEGQIRIAGVAGTPVFMAPEIWSGGSTPVTAAADAWSLGVTLFLLLFGTSPFRGANRLALIRSIQNDDPTIPQSCPKDWRELLQGLLHRDPAARLTPGKLLHLPMFADLREAMAAAARPNTTHRLDVRSVSLEPASASSAATLVASGRAMNGTAGPSEDPINIFESDSEDFSLEDEPEAGPEEPLMMLGSGIIAMKPAKGVTSPIGPRRRALQEAEVASAITQLRDHRVMAVFQRVQGTGPAVAGAATAVPSMSHRPSMSTTLGGGYDIVHFMSPRAAMASKPQVDAPRTAGADPERRPATSTGPSLPMPRGASQSEDVFLLDDALPPVGESGPPPSSGAKPTVQPLDTGVTSPRPPEGRVSPGSGGAAHRCFKGRSNGNSKDRPE